MNNFMGLIGTCHGIYGSPVYLQEGTLEKNVVSYRENKQLSLKIVP